MVSRTEAAPPKKGICQTRLINVSKALSVFLFSYFYLFNFLGECIEKTEREKQRERERERERENLKQVPHISAEPDEGLELTKCKITT